MLLILSGAFQTVDKAPSCEGAFLGLRAMGAL